MKQESFQLTWEYWGAKLRQLREQAGKTQVELAGDALLSKSTISALETGERTPKQAHAEVLDAALSTGGELTRLRRDIRRKQDIPAWWASALALEQRSQEIWEYEPWVIPGLLQTKEYAYEVIRSGQPRLPHERIVKDVAQRVERLQKLQEKGLPLLRFIVGEKSLSRASVDGVIMVKQLDYITSLVESKVIRLQVLPEEEMPLGVYQPFRINVLSDTKSVVYLEYFTGGVTQDDPSWVANMVTLYGHLASESMSTRETLDWIGKVRAQWNGRSPATVEQQETV